MSLLDQIKKDIEDITGNPNEFGREIIFVAPDESMATVTGLHTKHHLGIDTDGNPVNSKNAHISISEYYLALQDYPVRNQAGEVNLKNHKVTVKDSTGNDCTYVIREWFPNETIGLITCILGDYE
jgi:hypothetical protein